jgi:hypothetical protein
MKNHYPHGKNASDVRPGKHTSHPSHLTHNSHAIAESAEVLENIKGLLA